jgi:hypothetical protein
MSPAEIWAMETAYVDGVVLMEICGLFGFAHQNDNGRSSIENAFFGSHVILPGVCDMRDALLEELAVDLDLRHRD